MKGLVRNYENPLSFPPEEPPYSVCISIFLVGSKCKIMIKFLAFLNTQQRVSALPRGFLKTECWVTYCLISHLIVWGGARYFAFLTISQVIWMLLGTFAKPTGLCKPRHIFLITFPHAFLLSFTEKEPNSHFSSFALLSVSLVRKTKQKVNKVMPGITNPGLLAFYSFLSGMKVLS